ncbi:hypothetical protein CJJ23_02255 [Mycoplasmopsis agassizii]|uniref:Type I restriction enzyme endonuclease subunit n=1 Tax=Mycoplasmopsis agassizii TaxID=33922 RepID=A0A269TJ82_9BACT|nr:type I restriction endonuclease subunit R [Mycoplasmopsis agassizii]PAK21447.1 hypothetical protein CJJ23_02255 [Mycoplasmopsis agassizii]
MEKNKYKTILKTEGWTLATEYKINENVKYISSEISEHDLEEEFVRKLRRQGIRYDPSLTTEEKLIKNLRKQIQKLNKYIFSDTDWDKFLSEYLSKDEENFKEKTWKIQENSTYSFRKENGELVQIKLIEKDEDKLSENELEVVRQFISGDNRFDVTILVNGLPLVHIELKKPTVDIKKAFNQIDEYRNKAFFNGSKLFQYVQIYVISNGNETKYYSTTTRQSSIKENNPKYAEQDKVKKDDLLYKKTSHSFDFTNYWADSKNNNILNLFDFTETFFEKNSLLKLITKYSVFTVDQKLLVMRPYQIQATEEILHKIEYAKNNALKPKDSGGYIWHTTGSGKTLTSFKTAILASKKSFIDKVIFVVDRKDLDFQTLTEYNKFQEGAVSGTIDTRSLTKRLEARDPQEKVIITTIQKLNNFVKNNKTHAVYSKNVVFIFDEAHRSQFGEMHKNITKSFKNYYLFGFTGTPIFAQNSDSNIIADEVDTKYMTSETTESVFGKPLHIYTIGNAIDDKNVLPFKVSYTETAKPVYEGNEKASHVIYEDNCEENSRSWKITEYILKNFADMTGRKDKNSYLINMVTNIEEVIRISEKNRKQALLNKKPITIKEKTEQISVSGFNSIFAVSSIEDARCYYNLFKIQQQGLDESEKIKVAMIYSYSPNEDIEDENNSNVDGLSDSNRRALDDAIWDYNIMFGTDYSTKPEHFELYYKDLSARVKNRQVDLLIVVNMFLTGFDAPTLNTLWIDKNVKMHGLIQAFSRTNRIFDVTKEFGNIVAFRNIEKDVENAIKTFGNMDSIENAKNLVLLKSFDEYYYGYEDFKGYKFLVSELKRQYKPDEPITLEHKERLEDFINLFNTIMKTNNKLRAYPDEFRNKKLLSEEEFNNYKRIYLDAYHQFKDSIRRDPNNWELRDQIDIAWEISLIKEVAYRIEDINMLLGKSINENFDKKKILDFINSAISSSPYLRTKKELLNDFIKWLNVDKLIEKIKDRDPEEYIGEELTGYVKKERLDSIKGLIQKYKGHLKEEETMEFMRDAFDRGEIEFIGEDRFKLMEIDDIFNHDEKLWTEIKIDLEDHFEKYSIN